MRLFKSVCEFITVCGIHVPAHGNRCCGHQFKIMPDRTGSEVGFVLKMKGGRLYYENTRRL